MFGVGRCGRFSRGVGPPVVNRVELDFALRGKQATTVIGGSPIRPQRKCRKIGNFADRSPGGRVRRIRVVQMAIVLRREIDQFLARRAQVALPLVDTTFEPVSRVEYIGGGVPPDELRPVRRTTPKYDADGRVTRENDKETARPSLSRLGCFFHARLRFR